MLQAEHAGRIMR